jgi:hypothetical protein
MNKLIKACTRMALLVSVSSLATLAVAQHPRGGAVPNPHGVPVTRPLQAHARRANAGPEYFAFRNTVDQVPLHPTTPVFKLSHAYPKTAPPATCKECPWLNVKVDFAPAFPPTTDPDAWHNGHWDEYLKTVLDYVKEGQDPNLDNKVGFKDEVNGKLRWFSVPWMAYDPTVGREYVHGTTNERTAHLNDLVNGPEEPTRGVNLLAGMSQGCKQEWKHGFETWAVGYYNEYGGYAIGRAFPVTGRPHVTKWMGSPMPDGLPFPVGTVVMKILTTNAPPDCVPYLKGSPEWQINRHKINPKTKEYLCDREVQISRVVQVDVAVVDPRSPTRWVYGTYAYDGTHPGKDFWEHLVPLGVQWGSDPWSFPAVPQQASLAVQQSVLNPGVKIYQHYGCEKRLAGPVDNSQSSCMSCHASGYAAPDGAPSAMGVNVPPSFGFDGMCTQYSLDNATYFQNQQAPQSFPGGRYPDAISLDTSLQLSVAFDQYGVFNTQHAPTSCKNPTP